MTKWHQTSLASFDKGWNAYVEGLEQALDELDADLDEAMDMASGVCTGEWCEATGHVVGELHEAVFSISEPPFTDEAASRRLKALRRKVRELYEKFAATEHKQETAPHGGASNGAEHAVRRPDQD